MTLRVEVRFDPAALVRANDGLEVHEIARRYVDAARRAIAAEHPGADVEVRAETGTRSTRATVSGVAELDARRIERTVLDLCWAVRETMAFG